MRFLLENFSRDAYLCSDKSTFFIHIFAYLIQRWIGETPCEYSNPYSMLPPPLSTKQPPFSLPLIHLRRAENLCCVTSCWNCPAEGSYFAGLLRPNSEPGLFEIIEKKKNCREVVIISHLSRTTQCCSCGVSVMSLWWSWFKWIWHHSLHCRPSTG